MKSVVFCTTCKGRAQHIIQTLPRNLADNLEAKFVLLNYNSQDGLLDYLKEKHSSDISDGKLVVYSYLDADRFRMAHAKNMAHRCGLLEGADILVNLDADNLTGPGFDHYVREKFREQDIFLWSRMVKEGDNRTPRGISGRIAVSTSAFLNVGGYDEKYDTWSPDDKDFNQRLRNLGYQAHEIDRKYLQGVLHNDKMRFKEYPHAQAEQDGEEFEEVRYSKVTVANYGRFGCGSVYRNFFSDIPVSLWDLPTRIFGIGMHKTGTTSLHSALQILGYESAHWRSAHWAKAIWSEMKERGKSPTLERHYAITDLPIALLYMDLDLAYPGSKFILTTRSEGKWLNSVRKHWDPLYNEFRSGWDKDPFTHRVHNILYGQKHFDEGVFLTRFRRHNLEAMEYFEDRPDDLLVIDVDKGPSWEPLCKFLNKPIPVKPYPRMYQSK